MNKISRLYFYTSLFCFVLAFVAISSTVFSRLYFPEFTSEEAVTASCSWYSSKLNIPYLKCDNNKAFASIINTLMIFTGSFHFIQYYIFAPFVGVLIYINLYFAVKFPFLLYYKERLGVLPEISKKSKTTLSVIIGIGVCAQLICLLYLYAKLSQ